MSQPLKVLMILLSLLLLLQLLQTVNSAKRHYKQNSNESYALNADNNKLCTNNSHSAGVVCVCFFCSLLCIQKCLSVWFYVWIECSVLHAEFLYFDVTVLCMRCMCLFSLLFIIFWFTFMCLNLNFKSLNCWHYLVHSISFCYIRMEEKKKSTTGATTPGIWNVAIRFM